MSQGTFLSVSETYSWDEVNHNNVNKGIYFIPLLNKTTQLFELSSSNMVSEHISSNDCDGGGVADYDSYGNNTCFETVQKSFDIDTQGGTGLLVTNTLQTTTQYDIDTGDFYWILDKPASQTTSTSVSYGSQHSSPTAFNTQSSTNIYSWLAGKRRLFCQGTYADNEIFSIDGTNGCDVDLEGSVNRSVSKHTQVDTYGNVTLLENRGVVHDGEQIRKVQTIYNDGYFPNTVRQYIDSSDYLENTYLYDAGTGQLESSTDPNGIVSVNLYDAFGFQVGQQTGQSAGGGFSLISPPVSVAMVNCIDNSTALCRCIFS